MKGSRPEDQIVDISQAAKMLKMSRYVLLSLCKRGVLTPIKKEGDKKKYFLLHELSAASEVLGSKLTVSDLAAIAVQAHVRSKAVERRLDEIFYLMGWYRVPLGLDEGDILLIYTRAEAVLEAPPETIKEVREWAEILFSIDEGYLALVAKHTDSNEPWKLFMDAAQKISANAPRSRFPGDPGLHFAYAYLEASREHLRHAAYLFCRHHLGARHANEVFRDGRTSPTEAIIQLLLPH